LAYTRALLGFTRGRQRQQFLSIKWRGALTASGQNCSSNARSAGAPSPRNKATACGLNSSGCGYFPRERPQVRYWRARSWIVLSPAFWSWPCLQSVGAAASHRVELLGDSSSMPAPRPGRVLEEVADDPVVHRGTMTRPLSRAVWDRCIAHACHCEVSMTGREEFRCPFIRG